MDFLLRMINRISNIDIWVPAAAIAAAGTSLFGEKFWAMFFLTLGLITVDTLTKWVDICKKFRVDMGREDCIRNVKLRIAFWQFLRAETWNKEYLNSSGISRIIEKIIWYTLSIMICFAAGKHMPEIHLFGFDLIPQQVFPGFISTAIFFVELSSLNENLIDLGYGSIADYVEKIKNFILDRLKGGR